LAYFPGMRTLSQCRSRLASVSWGTLPRWSNAESNHRHCDFQSLSHGRCAVPANSEKLGTCPSNTKIEFLAPDIVFTIYSILSSKIRLFGQAPRSFMTFEPNEPAALPWIFQNVLPISMRDCTEFTSRPMARPSKPTRPTGSRIRAESKSGFRRRPESMAPLVIWSWRPIPRLRRYFQTRSRAWRRSPARNIWRWSAC
jgi:hypothetical protein